MIPYQVSPRAARDLDNQALYYSTHAGEAVAFRFLRAARATMELLATQPEMGWHPRLKHPRLKSMRVFRIKGFEKLLILYKPGKEQILILRVVHGSRNIELLLTRRT